MLAASPRSANVLVVDDDRSVRILIARILATATRTISQAANILEAQQMAERLRPDLVVADVVMPGGSGLDLRRSFSSRFPGVPVILISGYSPDQVAEFVAQTPATLFLPKPFSIADLSRLVDKVLDRPPFAEHTAPDAAE